MQESNIYTYRKKFYAICTKNKRKYENYKDLPLKSIINSYNYYFFKQLKLIYIFAMLYYKFLIQLNFKKQKLKIEKLIINIVNKKLYIYINILFQIPF